MALVDEPAYTGIARGFHWIMAVLIILLIPGGIMLEHLPEGTIQNTAYNMHRSLGFVVLVLAVLRLGYRLTHRPKPLGPEIAAWQKGVSHAVHWALYLLMIAQPIVGWVATNAFGAPITVFGLFELPMLVAKTESLVKPLFGLHKLMGVSMGALILMHVGAAFMHLIVHKDGVMQRMLGR